VKIETTYHVRLDEDEQFDVDHSPHKVRANTIVFLSHGQVAVAGPAYRKDGTLSRQSGRLVIDEDEIPQDIRVTLIRQGVRAGSERTV
jgi:hypothetical protein